MDVFSKKRITGWAVVILVLLNLALLATIWINKPGKAEPRVKGQGQQTEPEDRLNQGQNRRLEQQRRLAEFLIHELRFTRDQMKRFEALRHEHHQKARELKKKTMDLRKEMMNELLAEKPDRDKARALSRSIGETFREIEETTFDHFLDLVNLCQPDQKPKFKQLLHEILDMMKPPYHGPPRGQPRKRPKRPPPHHDGPPPHRDRPPPNDRQPY